MRSALQITISIISVLLIAVVLLQGRGSGLSNIFGGSSNFYSTKRGAEKFLFIATIILGIGFLTTSLLLFLLQ